MEKKPLSTIGCLKESLMHQHKKIPIPEKAKEDQVLVLLCELYTETIIHAMQKHTIDLKTYRESS